MEMKQPELRKTKSGSRCLVCYYSGDQYDQAIEQAERDLNDEGDRTITIIALPMSSKFYDFK